MPRLISGKPALAQVRAGVKQCSVFTLSGEGQRTSSAARTRQREDGAQYRKSVPSKGDGQHNGEQKPSNPSPRCKARQRHLIKPATALNHPEDPRKRDAGKKTEQSKEKRKRDVGGADTDYEQEDEPRAEPCRCPDQAHPDCSADSSQPLPHDDLPCTLRRKVHGGKRLDKRAGDDVLVQPEPAAARRGRIAFVNGMRTLAWCGVVAPILRFGFILVLGALHPGYSQARDFISELGARQAPFALPMNVGGTALVGLLVAGFSVALYDAYKPGRLARASAWLLAISGVAFVAVGIFPCDPGCSMASPSASMRLHLLSALVATASQAAAPLALGWHLFTKNGQRSLAQLSLVLGCVASAAFVVSLAGGAELPFAGLVQRVNRVTDLWVLMIAIHMLRWGARSHSPEADGAG